MVAEVLQSDRISYRFDGLKVPSYTPRLVAEICSNRWFRLSALSALLTGASLIFAGELFRRKNPLKALGCVGLAGLGASATLECLFQSSKPR